MLTARLKYDSGVHAPEHDGAAGVELDALLADALHLRVGARRHHSLLRLRVSQRRLVAAARLQLLRSRNWGPQPTSSASRNALQTTSTVSSTFVSLSAGLLLGGGDWEPHLILHSHGVRRCGARLSVSVPVRQLPLLCKSTLLNRIVKNDRLGSIFSHFVY